MAFAAGMLNISQCVLCSCLNCMGYAKAWRIGKARWTSISVGQWKIELEAYYYSGQQLSDGAYGTSYWITGLIIENLWEDFSLFINFENFSNIRQTKFDTIYTCSMDNPVFRDIYAPVDGFVVNGGIKIKL